jgi:hypothetical protein
MTTSFAMRIAVGDEAVLLHLKSETYLGLDAVGTRMWNLLTASDSIERAYEALLQEYDVESDQLRRDLDEFVRKLLVNDLVQVSPNDAGRKGAE